MNSFEIIPAIDILNGKCVRLTQGKYDQVEEFSTDPLDIAKKWIDGGAKRLHIVDLDGAKDGSPVNKNLIIKLAKETKTAIEVGGGIRTLESIKEYINEGIKYLILGTKAFQDKEFLDKALEMFGEKIIIGLDMKHNKIALSGWLETKEMDLESLKAYLSGVKQIIYTDISKDGMLTGPNLKSIKEISTCLKSEIIVSGGIAKIEDIIELLKLKRNGLANISGVILGKSLYKGNINLNSAIQLVEKEVF